MVTNYCVKMTKRDIIITIDDATDKILKPYRKERVASKVICYLVQKYEKEIDEKFSANLGV
jgi:hypothetical protein